MNTTLAFARRRFNGFIWLALVAFGPPNWLGAQSKLGVQEAVTKALESRASLKAEVEQVSVSEGLKRQAATMPNPEFQFENENLRPGMVYTRDVDTYANLLQPLDVLGKRTQRVALAEQGVVRTKAEYELARLQIVQSVRLAYWKARGAQEARDLLTEDVKDFQDIIDYHSAQLSVGAISEQDYLRIRLEGESLSIAANLAVLEATRSRIDLLKEMGQSDFTEVVLSEPLDTSPAPLDLPTIDQVLAQRGDLKVARAAVEQAQANLRLQDVAARPDLSIVYGYKRTQLVDTASGVNTAIAGLRITLPITDRNQGNRAAAEAEVRRQQQLLAATEANARADYASALQEYAVRDNEVVDTLQPLREHATEIATIARGAYEQGGTDLLRLLDAERARIEAELAWVQGMVDYQQSIVNLEAAEGVSQ